MTTQTLDPPPSAQRTKEGAKVGGVGSRDILLVDRLWVCRVARDCSMRECTDKVSGEQEDTGDVNND